MKKKDIKNFVIKTKNKTAYYDRISNKQLNNIIGEEVNVLKKINTAIRYNFLFYHKTSIRKDILKILKKHKANINISSLLRNMLNIVEAQPSNNIISHEKRDDMNGYIEQLTKSLNREWELNIILKDK